MFHSGIHLTIGNTEEKKKNSRLTKPFELSLGTSKFDMLCPVRRRAGKEIQQV